MSMSSVPPTPIITGVRSWSRVAAMNRSCLGLPRATQTMSASTAAMASMALCRRMVGVGDDLPAVGGDPRARRTLEEQRGRPLGDAGRRSVEVDPQAAVRPSAPRARAPGPLRDPAGDRQAEQLGGHDQRHAVGQAEIGLVQHAVDRWIGERVDHEVGVHRDDLVRLRPLTAECHEALDLGHRPVHVDPVDRDAEHRHRRAHGRLNSGSRRGVAFRARPLHRRVVPDDARPQADLPQHHPRRRQQGPVRRRRGIDRTQPGQHVPGEHRGGRRR